jgi:hypothetical protein
MSTAATVISNLGTYNWNARVYDALALASSLAATVKRRGHVLQLAYALHDLNGTLSEFLKIVNDGMEGKGKADPNAEPVTPQMLRSSADNLEQLYRTLDFVLEGSRRAGLMNNSLTAGSLRKIRRSLEPIANLADWFDLASQPEAMDKIFETAKREKERGELIDLAQVE